MRTLRLACTAAVKTAFRKFSGAVANVDEGVEEGELVRVITASGDFIAVGKKIPELMRGLGKGVKSFKDGVNEAKEEINKAKDEIDAPADSAKK